MQPPQLQQKLPVVREDFILSKINNTNGAQGVGGQIQLIIPANTYHVDSVVCIQYNGAANVANTSNVVERNDMCFIFNSQCTVLQDGIQIGLYQKLCVEQLAWYQRYIKDPDNNSFVAATGTTAIQRWKPIAIGTGNAQIIKTYKRLKHFLPGLFDLDQKYFTVKDQMTITISIINVTGVLGTQVITDGPSSLVTGADTTSVQIQLYMKTEPNQQLATIPPYIRIYQQYQYLGATSVTPIQNIPFNQICDKQTLAFCSQNGTIFTLDGYLLNATTFTVSKNGYYNIQANDLQEAKAQMAMANKGDERSFNNLINIYEQAYQNISINYNISVSAAMDIYVGYYIIQQN